MTDDKAAKPDKRKLIRMDRRRFVEMLAFAGIAGTVVSFLSLLMSLLPSASACLMQGDVDNVLRYGPGKGTWYSDKSGTEVKLEDFDTVGKGASAIWRGGIPAIVIRVDENKLQGATATDGLICFASACTHLCCISSWHIDRPNEDVLFCRCHDGIFDPYTIVKDTMPDGTEYLGAKVVSGPPPRAAPIIPIEIKDGKIAGIPKNLETYIYCGCM